MTVMYAGLFGAVPVMMLALWFVLGADGLGDYPDRWIPLALGAIAVSAYGLCEVVIRPAPLGPEGDPEQVRTRSRQQFVSAGFVRLAICEPVFLFGIALGFVADSYWPVLIGGVLVLPLMWWEVWPGPRNKARFAAALERGGHRSYLV